MIIDGTTLIKLLLFECEILSDVFLFVVLIPTLFTVFAYKMQQIPQYVVFNHKQVKKIHFKKNSKKNANFVLISLSKIT